MIEDSQAFAQAYRTIFKVEFQRRDEAAVLPRVFESMPSAVTRTPIMDLHTHTTYSDGSYSPVEIIREAAARGLKAVSITDHDGLRAYIEESDIFGLAEQSGLQLLPGVEVTCLDRHPAWKNSGGRRPVHILLYFPRLPEETHAAQHVARLADLDAFLRPRRCWWQLAVTHLLFALKKEYPGAGLTMRGFVHWLCQENDKEGIPNPDMSWVNSHPCEDFDFWVVAWTTGTLPGQIPRRAWDSNVILYAIEQIRASHDLPDGVTDAYQFFHYVHRYADRYLGTPEAYPDWYGMPVERAIEAAHRHGGVAVYAHPYCDLRTLGPAQFEIRTASLRLDGYEAYSTLHSGSESLYFAGLDGIQTIGSDFHGVTTPDITLGLGKAGCHGMQTTREQLQTLIASGMLRPSVADNLVWISVPGVRSEAAYGRGTPDTTTESNATSG